VSFVSFKYLRSTYSILLGSTESYSQMYCMNSFLILFLAKDR